MTKEQPLIAYGLAIACEALNGNPGLSGLRDISELLHKSAEITDRMIQVIELTQHIENTTRQS